MAKLTRVTGKLFGETATATGDNPQIGQFGSALAGTYVASTDIETIQNLTAWSNGFIDSVTPSENFPPLPEMTGFGKVLSYQQNYLLQQGMPEWDSATTYYTNSYCSYNGVIYVSLSDNNTNNNPASSPTKWSVYGISRNIGEIVTSTIPLTDAGLQLLDGTKISGNGIYADFVTYMAQLYTANPTAAYFTDEASWQSSVSLYGVCGKFVYDSVNNTVRVPKITGILEGTTNLTALDDLVQAGLPNITGSFTPNSDGVDVLQTMEVSTPTATGCMSFTARYLKGTLDYTGDTWQLDTLSMDASRSNPIYGNSNTVQPQTIKVLYYIVIANTTKTEIEVDIDNIVTDLNGKSDIALSNLSTTGEARLHSLKSYEDAGELLTDAEGLADITKYAHSSFDSSKFTKVGSPIVTSDGIASNFSTSNYLNTGYLLNTARPWVIYSGKVQFPNVTTQQIVFCSSYANSSSNNNPIIVNLQSTGKMRVILASSNNYGTSSPDILEAIGATNFSANTDYWFKLEFTGTKYNFYYSTDGKNYTLELDTTSSTSVGAGYIYLGIRLFVGVSGSPLLGSIDLKQFSITVDEVPVFSGNDTGVDTIKPDNYTKVGSPTISYDEIVDTTSFTSSNYITCDLPITKMANGNAWDLYIPIRFKTLPPAATNIGLMKRPSGDYPCQLGFNGNTIRIFLSSNNSSWDIVNTNVSYTWQLNTDYIIHLGFTGSKYFLNINNTEVWSLASTSKIYNTGDLAYTFGYWGSYNGLFYLDLNAFKIYVDNSLVYQPCLKIPFTRSKTGAKVVDSVYRPRVADMYSQFGYAPYYTLLEGTNFTLPQGEIYGLLGDTSRIAGYALPAPTSWTELTVGTSGSTYVAPANGWFCAEGYNSSNNTGSISMSNSSMRAMSNAGTGDYTGAVIIPAIKGETVTLNYSNITNWTRFRFVYAVGEV